MIGSAQYADVRDVIEFVELAIAALTFADDSSSATAYELSDRVDQWPHLGVVVDAPASADTDRLDGVDAMWAEDTIAVELRVHLARTPGQRVMRDRALDHERKIRDAVCASAALQLYRPTWVSATREKSSDRAWLHIVQTFRFERFERVRRVA